MSEAAFSKVLEQVDSILQAGGKVALVSDAGTPGIADPGGKMVEQIVMRGQRVIPIPGPASVTTLLSISGLALQNVLFMGFLPKKKGRQTDLKKMVALLEDGFVEGVVIYESPHRIVKLLEELSGSLLTLVLGRELTKKFEEVRRGSPEELLLDFGARKSVKGEITLLVTKLGV